MQENSAIFHIIFSLWIKIKMLEEEELKKLVADLQRESETKSKQLELLNQVRNQSFLFL